MPARETVKKGAAQQGNHKGRRIQEAKVAGWDRAELGEGLVQPTMGAGLQAEYSAQATSEVNQRTGKLE